MERLRVPRSLTLLVGALVAALGAVAARPGATHAQSTSTHPTLYAESVTQTTVTIRWDTLPPAGSVYVLLTDATPNGSWLERQLTPEETQARVLLFHSLQADHWYHFDIYSPPLPDCPITICIPPPFCALPRLCVSTLPPTSAPAAPTNLRLCGSGSLPEVCPGGGILLYWRDNATTEDHYEFQWAKGQPGTPPPESAYTKVWLPANRISYGFSPPSSGTYHFRVRACNAVCSAPSNRVEKQVGLVLVPAP